MNLVIVESPAKAKTINKYLGDNFNVLASYGHVRDLPSKNGSVDPLNDFAFEWEVSNTSKKHIKEKPITQSIPESTTIQYVIQHLTPTLFRSKSEAKYFLTVLGDNILKKSTNITHFTRLESKDFLTCLQDLIQ